MHGVLSAMWYIVVRFAVLVTCDVVWFAMLYCDVMCLSAICFDVLDCAVMHGV